MAGISLSGLGSQEEGAFILEEGGDPGKIEGCRDRSVNRGRFGASTELAKGDPW